ncbi:hypothetical protein BaRGS_00031079 [Batillaria attramentaria]|uniref:Uncharacterized protein n=1 Tax=Batillaria attramentaria TaxID=370345 RepID=A0ABD0JRL3_9CAEN
MVICVRERNALFNRSSMAIQLQKSHKRTLKSELPHLSLSPGYYHYHPPTYNQFHVPYTFLIFNTRPKSPRVAVVMSSFKWNPKQSIDEVPVVLPATGEMKSQHGLGDGKPVSRRECDHVKTSPTNSLKARMEAPILPGQYELRTNRTTDRHGPFAREKENTDNTSGVNASSPWPLIPAAILFIFCDVTPVKLSGLSVCDFLKYQFNA